ncbi:hypothetical protein [Isoptericola halotolerans]|uniref:Zinc ribbon domain-containing protein n=1 Tax=Isoptericola halotolerans TaxID=300560 RepID=A0ABX2A861_9MICO|nr:hypothetical protein [Isoptericola halotolerans]NOV98801.1 hypothetical protein [Isoptericola halotolerans]
MTTGFSDADLEPLYTLRAEDMQASDLERWTAVVPGDESVLRKLTGPGPKLLKGPRGSGKSTFLKRAYARLSSNSSVLVAYINYSTHLALEPLMLNSEQSLEHFRQWLVYKVIIGLDEAHADSSPPQLRELAKVGRSYINELGTKTGEAPKTQIQPMSPAELLNFIERLALDEGRSRVVLLMDDAAHAFMQQQQREFFELFRALRSRTVACKAAIYPGVTSYSPFFNVGHEAEEIEIWIRPDGPDYLPTMRAIFKARFPESMQEAVRQELVDMAAHAAFGLPRNFLNILSDSLGDPDDREFAPSAPSLRRLRVAIQDNANRARALFAEISKKLPRYANFVEVGSEVQNNMVDQIRKTNMLRSRGPAKYVGIAIAQPWGSELGQIVSLLEYAGSVRRIGTVSRGETRYERVQIHTSILFAETALGLGRNLSAEDANRALARQSADDFVRRQADRIMTHELVDRCRLNLSPCPVCQSPRVSEDAAFCYKCGASLTVESVYASLLAAKVEVLDLPELKVHRIQDANIRTVQDVILDEGGSRLRSVKSIGEIWSARIKARAEEFVTL